MTGASGAAWRVWRRVTKPVIAKIDGYCIGGGLLMALQADIRICSEPSTFAIPAARLGLGYGFGGVRQLMHHVNPAIASEILFSARRFSSAEALQRRARQPGGAGRRVWRRRCVDAGGPDRPQRPADGDGVQGGDPTRRRGRPDADTSEVDALAEACFRSQDYLRGPGRVPRQARAASSGACDVGAVARRPRRARPHDRPRRSDGRALPRRLGRSRAAHRADAASGGSILGDHDSSDYINLHRSKQLIGLDLTDAGDRRRFFRLVEHADIIVENNRAPVKAKLGIDYEACAAVNPRIIYGSIAGYGQDGPASAKGAVDQIIQGVGGLMSITGLPGQGPVRAGIAVSDSAAGHQLAIGILLALRDRERTGRGQWVKVSLLEAMISFLDFQAVRWTIDGARAAAGGQPPPDRPADGHVPGRRRLPQHRRAGRSAVDRGCATCSASRPLRRRALRHAGRPLPQPRRARRAARRALRPPAAATSGSPCSTRPACRAGRSTRSTRCSPIRRCSTWRCWRASPTPTAATSTCCATRSR